MTVILERMLMDGHFIEDAHFSEEGHGRSWALGLHSADIQGRCQNLVTRRSR